MTHDADLSPGAAAMERNLQLLPWWWLLRIVWFGEAIWVVYLIEVRGLTLGEVFLFEAAFAASQLLAEVPTGLVADRYGRRISVCLGGTATAAGILIFGLAEPIPVLLIAYVCFGVGEAFMSGADQALLFDSLRALRRESEFAARAGRYAAYQTAALAVMTVAGGIAASWTPLAWPIVISGFLTLPGAVLALRLTEPPRHENRGTIVSIGRQAFGRVRRSPALAWVIVLMAVLTSSFHLLNVTLQPVVVDYGGPLWILGLAAGAQFAVAALGGTYAGAAGRWLGLPRLLRVLPVVAALSLFAGVGSFAWLLPLFLLSPLAWNLAQPHIADFLSRRSAGSERATLLSINAAASSVAAIIVTLATGLMVDQLGRDETLAIAAATLALVAVTAYLRWQRAGDLTLEPVAGVDPPPHHGAS